MKSIVEVDVDVPQAKVAALYANPENTTQWMDDVDRYEVISGEPGMPGSKYRLVPRKGTMVFVATVISSRLPDESRLELEASSVVVSVTGRFVALSPGRTRLISEEVFRFKGLFRTVLGLFASPAIRNAHRRHIEAFKRFAESHG
jgi:hypothetical protein